MSSPQVPVPKKTGSSTRVIACIVGVLAGLFVTPIAIALIAWAQNRQLRRFQLGSGQTADLTALALTLLGALFLLVVALLAMWAPLAPLLGGIVFGVLPSLVQYVQPSWIFRVGRNLYVPLDGPFTNFYIGSAPIVLGVVLVGAGLAGMLARLIRA